jgi:uncharacterized membrane protein YdjX (TVP38/TMEM64 family)
VFKYVSRRLVIGLLVLAVGLLVLNYFVDINQDDLESAIDRAGIVGPAVYTMLLIVGLSVPFTPFSDLLTVTVASIVLNPIHAIAATFIAHTISVTANYIVGWRYGERLLDWATERREIPLVRQLRRRVDVRAVFFLRFALPLTAIGVDIVGYLAGMQRLKFPAYWVASMVPWTLMSVIFFTSAAFLREIAPYLVVVPAIAIIVTTSAFVLIIRKKTSILDVPHLDDEPDNPADGSVGVVSESERQP